MVSPVPTVDASLTTPATAIAFEDAFFDMYKPVLPEVKKRLEGIADLDKTSKAADSRYFAYETAAHPRIWLRGDPISSEAFKGRSWTVVNFFYGKSIPWYYEDEQDDQTGQLLPKAQELGLNHALLPERLFFQVLSASADADLLPLIPTASDGAAWFSATNGAGNARFGVTGGNIVNGQGVETVSAVRSDYYRGRQRIKSFQDTKGQPRYPEEMIQDFVIVAPVAMEEVLEQAFNPNIVQGLNAGISQPIATKSLPRIFTTQRLTGPDWYLFCSNIPIKAFFRQIREGLQTNTSDFSNSDETRRYRKREWFARERMGIGLSECYQCVKIDK